MNASSHPVIVEAVVRQSLVEFFNSVRSDVFSFVAGAVFSILINLATQKAQVSGIQFLLMIAALLVSTIGFVWLGLMVRAAEEEAAKDPDPGHRKLVKINNRFRALCLASVVALGPLVVLAIVVIY